ncbi:TIGR01459 family HAD-type hydrolase [Rhodoblastus acidophilus]|uniref:TIGR01459 family HAD-type hydrolase n=1 Tax=Candidatus Rhodoblastus alkanivorans TaxID=2954117 RepID=A0ABS9Z377_9HYPH|nr:TIGR01459 family HAD-type hydrolase [Candidatus Rhodoblastus alkanivorans]MCI4679914.1 TIGR01459 family HAD-type hydrolase [Candidatus Rhodoblastus alkanivorans]MCI4681511.1 TIGR01459 family HAD-type hydrolase [Candidatus Rhodoblastus alkanivorans]MDI4642559.1 TIGR01459 family HAD-type hydrolase [Rhodoblastus acidophilus]
MTGNWKNRESADAIALTGLAQAQDRYDAFLCDIWGVLHNGEHGFAPAATTLRELRRRGKAVTLITNAPRPKGEVAEQLAALGIDPNCYDAIATSGDVCARAIAERAPRRPFHIGPERDRPVFAAAGALTMQDVAPVALAEADFVVCTGLVEDTQETPADYEDVLVDCRAKNLPMICANPDLVVYRGDQLVYCAGALAERYVELGGEVEQAGKPYAPIYRMAIGLLERAKGKPLDIDRILAIGDAIHTDIAGAATMGLDSLLITQGIHRTELHGPNSGALDTEAYKQFVESHGVTPVYRMSRLVW